MPNQNGRNQNRDDSRGEQRSWRPQDDDRMMREPQRDEDERSTERYGGGQSGYGSGRFGDDRSMGPGYRNQSSANRSHDDRQGMHTDDRFSGRGGEGYWEDRTERTGYNSGYNQGGMGYGSQGGAGMQRGGSQQAFRSNNAGAQNMASEYNQGRYPDMYGPDDNYGSQGGRQSGRYGQGANYQQADFEHGVGYGQGTGGRWANAPQAGMQQGGYSQRGGQQGGQSQGSMQGNYSQGMQGGYAGGMQGGYGGSGMQGGYGQPQGIGGHRGKGPQGYTRSDDRIKETVCETLHDDDHIDATNIEVVVKNGEVILTGTVEDRRQKRVAEDIVERLPGVKDVQNQLRCGGDRRGNQMSGSAVGRTETETSATASTSDKKHRA